MAVQTITYDDKQFLNQNSDIADINKVNDTDMTMIKNVVNNNANELTTLEEQFNLSNSETITSGSITGGGSLSSVNVTIDSNANGSLAKIYGQIDVASNTHSGDVVISTNLSPTSQLIIKGSAYRSVTRSGSVINNALTTITIDTNGDVTIPYVYVTGSGETCRISLIGCLIFVKNLGS